jgi:integrase/recombinase XerD
VRCMGKGRKERCTPLTKSTVAVLKEWLGEPARRNTEMLFPSAKGSRLSADSVEDLLDKHVAVAGHTCPSLRKKRVTRHVLRHTAAMELLQAGVHSGVLPITHDFIATMMGTDRSTVSLAASVLQKKGIIDYVLGAVKIVSRRKLEKSACECYDVIQQCEDELGLR